MSAARKVVVVVVGLLAVMVVFSLYLDATGYVPSTDPPPPHVISGTFTLVDEDTAANGCVGPDGGNWRAVHPGAEVEVRDGTGWYLASGSLGDGRATTWGTLGDAACEYDYSVGVPVAEKYTIHFPGGLAVDYTFEELDSADWHVSPDCCRFVPAG
jgi:hypothetical protein